MKEGFSDVNLTWRSLIEETVVVVRRQDTPYVVVHRISRAVLRAFKFLTSHSGTPSRESIAHIHVLSS